MNQLYLYDNYLSGCLPGSLGMLRGLQLFLAYKNLLSCSIPDEIGMVICMGVCMGICMGMGMGCMHAITIFVSKII